MNLTGEQRAILAAAEVDVAVAASAGTGKTHVLVERYIRLLDGCRVPEIAAVTFTEAAAAEMRDRVRRAVVARADLARHRHDLDEAVIGTIHSFCLRLLREHPVGAAIDPAASILAEDEAELLRHLASRTAVDAAAEAADERTAALRALGTYHAELMLPRMIAARDDVRRAYEALGERAAWAETMRTRIDEMAKATVRALRPRVEDAVAEMRSLRHAVSPKVRDVIDAVLTAYDAPAEWVECALAAKAAVNRRPGRQNHPPDVDAKQAMAVLQQAGSTLGGLPVWNEHDGAALPILDGLRVLFEDACRRYEAAKAEQHGLDFLDLELGAVALLRGHPRVASETRTRFRHVMVDEAQDVSPLQAELLRLLTGEDKGEGRRPWLFLVGDAKQSIYRFRGADVAQFHALHQEVRGRGGESLPLSRSFRTHDALVACFNAIFGGRFVGAPYDAVTRTAMTGRGASPEGPHLVLIPIAKKDVAGDGTTTQERRRVEAAAVADEVARLLDEEAPVWDKRAGAYRRVRPGDMALLLRRFTNVHIFEQALEDRGIPYATPSGTGFYTRPEVLDLSNLLRWLAEPEDQIALMGVLRSPLFALGDDTLLVLAQAGRTLWDGLRTLPAGVHPDDRRRSEHALAVLTRLRALASQAAVDAVLEAALHDTAVEATWSAIEGGEQALANIRKLMRIVCGLAGYSIAEVVDYLEQRRDDLDVREGPAVLDRPDAVQLMTVHGAKGLEFPVVFVPEAMTEPRQSYDAVRWRPRDGISVTLAPEEDDTDRRRPGFLSYLLERDRTDDEAEHGRLFYVATTRAADRVYLSGDEDSGGWLGDVVDVIDALAPHVEVRDTAIVGAGRPAGHRTRRVAPPPESEETDYLSVLAARPAVIPLRSSTPVTALKPPAAFDLGATLAMSDGLALLRGNVAHRAIEERYAHGREPDLDTIAREEAQQPLDAAALAAVVEDVRAILGRFEASAVAAAVRASTDARFELPFAWDWDGIPVHGAIDLAYRDAAGWCVVDFKTDRVPAAGVRALAERYLVQVGLYGRALEAATGTRPRLGLLFLSAGELHEPDWAEVEAALAAARARVDAGGLLDSDEPVPAEDALAV